jgi:hypothetical protein
MTFRLLACGMAVLVVTACAGQGNILQPTQAPANYKNDILAFLRTYLNDPTNIRDAAVAPPSLQRVGREDRYVACVRFNARRLDGSYAGSLSAAAVFSPAGRLDRFIDLTPDESAPDASLRDQLRDGCKTATYQPFPELAQLTR